MRGPERDGLPHDRCLEFAFGMPLPAKILKPLGCIDRKVLHNKHLSLKCDWPGTVGNRDPGGLSCPKPRIPSRFEKLGLVAWRASSCWGEGPLADY